MKKIFTFYELLRLFVDTFRTLFTRKTRGYEILYQMFLIGNKSLLFITITLSFLGLISIYQSCNQIEKVIPDFSFIGAAFILLIVREFAPVITALMIATKVGSGIAAEIGSMVVTDQIDALKMCNTDPVQYIIVPRFIACIIMMFILSIYAALVAIFAGMVMGYIEFQINPRTFFNLQLLKFSDLYIGIIKALVFGAAIPVISAHSGLRAEGGSEGVGWATTRAVVNSSFSVVILDFVLSSLWYILVK